VLPDSRVMKLIGIGAGHPEQITLQAIHALARVDVLFLTDKGEDSADLLAARKAVCAQYMQSRPHRTVVIQDPARDRAAGDYTGAVRAWHDARADVYEQLIEQHLGAGECGALLVWGDPAIYDSALRLLQSVLARGRVSFDYEIIPGISSIQALAARHRISLHDIGQSIHITTGRRLSDADFDAHSSVVVLLDGRCAFAALTRPDLIIYWGAYLGTSDELLIAGALSDVSEQILAARADARRRKGWILDIYLLRRHGGP
jgi:precorrin-6A synthase